MMSKGPGTPESTRTTCARCAVGCGLRTVAKQSNDGRRLDAKKSADNRTPAPVPRLRVTGDPTHRVSEGRACRRGIEETAGVADAADRLVRPMIRRDDELAPVPWSVALDAIASRIEPRAAADPDRIGVFGSGQQTTEAAYLLGKVARGIVGTRHYDANTTLCMAAAVNAYRGAFGADAPPPTYTDIPRADSHIVWGANPAIAHPVLFSWIRESAAAPDSELIVVDPVRTRTAAAADRHVRPNPDTDVALARAVLAAIVARGGVADSFVETHTVGFNDLRDRLPEPDAAAETAGVPRETVDRVAGAFTDRTLVYWGMGINQSTQGTAAARALVDLCLATGNLGPGAGPFSLTGQANSMGARLGSSKGTWPGGWAFDNPTARRHIADTWGIPCDRLPADPGPGPVDLFGAVADGRVDTLWTVATNPAVGMPNVGPIRAALDDTFLIVQDAFRTATVEYADVVLPAATWGETTGTLVSMDRTISRVRPSRDSPGDARPDTAIIAAVADQIRPGIVDSEADPSALFAELAALTAGTPVDCTHVSYERLDQVGPIRWPRSTADFDRADRPGATAIGSEDEKSQSRDRYRYCDSDGEFSFPTADGRARFSTAHHRSVPEPPDERYPLVLTTARKSDAYNTGVRSGEGDDPLPLRVSPATQEAFVSSFDGCDRTVLVSRRGRVLARVDDDDRIPEGVVWAPIHHPDTNLLTLDAVDPESGEPAYKSCAVRFEPP